MSDEKNKGGQPTKYRPEFVDQAYRLCLLRAIDKEIAEFFGVVEATLYNWKNEHPDFADAIRRGKEQADMEVSSRLFARAVGQKVKKQQAIKIREDFFDDTGKKIKSAERIEIVDLEEELPADVKAQIYWLNNRRNKNAEPWKDRQDHELTGKNGAALPGTTINLTSEVLKLLPTDALEKLAQDEPE
jgi:hypothetical protein